MTQEQIEKAARESSTRAGYNIKIAADVTGRTVYECAFEAGAQWRINSVWHEASERPEVNKRVLVEFFNKYGNYVYYRLKAFKPAQLKYWGIEMAFLDKIIRWTYIEDLLPADSK